MVTLRPAALVADVRVAGEGRVTSTGLGFGAKDPVPMVTGAEGLVESLTIIVAAGPGPVEVLQLMLTVLAESVKVGVRAYILPAEPATASSAKTVRIRWRQSFKRSIEVLPAWRPLPGFVL